MSKLSDNLPACYAYTVNFIRRFAEGFVLPSRASFTRYFTFPQLTFTFPLFISSLYLVFMFYFLPLW